MPARHTVFLEAEHSATFARFACKVFYKFSNVTIRCTFTVTVQEGQMSKSFLWHRFPQPGF